jgi:two-component system probable response regulator PhcQ
VLTAISVERVSAVLSAHHADIAVLVCDQRMPGERGNELLRHARQHYPNIVRMLTTAYSELGEAIDAINTGEIYRYIAKPWELENLRTDLKNALELADLRNERDELRDKLLAQQSALGSRLDALLTVSAAVHSPTTRPLCSVCAGGPGGEWCGAGGGWNRWDHADLQARRGAGIAATCATGCNSGAHARRRPGAVAARAGMGGGPDGAVHLSSPPG